MLQHIGVFILILIGQGLSLPVGGKYTSVGLALSVENGHIVPIFSRVCTLLQVYLFAGILVEQEGVVRQVAVMYLGNLGLFQALDILIGKGILTVEEQHSLPDPAVCMGVVQLIGVGTGAVDTAAVLAAQSLDKAHFIRGVQQPLANQPPGIVQPA